MTPHDPDVKHGPKDGGPRGELAALASSFRYAGAGLWWALTTQRNLRIHIALGLMASILALVLRFSPLELAVLVLLMTVVIALELVNTVVEAAVDLASPGRHPLAKIAKDVAAGAVLVAAAGAVVIGLLLFLPHLL